MISSLPPSVVMYADVQLAEVGNASDMLLSDRVQVDYTTGIATTSIILTKAMAIICSASFNGSNILESPRAIEVRPASINPTATSFALQTGDIIAGEQFSVTAEAHDEFSNRLLGGGGLVQCALHEPCF
jgi:hypothetical protein